MVYCRNQLIQINLHDDVDFITESKEANIDGAGPEKQKFHINLGVVKSWSNLFLDHNRQILGQHFLRKYLILLDFLKTNDDFRSCIFRVLFAVQT